MVPPSAAPAVSTFHFHSHLLQGALCLRQPDVGGAIGFKLYPAALVLCALIEAGIALQEGRDCSSDGAGSAGASAGAGAGAGAGTGAGAGAPTGGKLASGGVMSMAAAAQRVQGLVPALSWRSAAVVEVGSGVCALPSMLLARVGALCLPTVSAEPINDVAARLCPCTASTPTPPF